MKQFKKEFLTQHLLVLCAMSIIGALVRNEAMQYGVDTFSCNLTFVISTTILMVVYLHALDSIVRLLAPWFKHIFCNTVNITERKRLSSIAINVHELCRINKRNHLFLQKKKKKTISPSYFSFFLILSQYQIS